MTSENPNEKLTQWLKENEYQLQVMVMAPRGGMVMPENFVPEGWRMSIQVFAKPKETADAAPAEA